LPPPRPPVTTQASGRRSPVGVAAVVVGVIVALGAVSWLARNGTLQRVWSGAGAAGSTDGAAASLGIPSAPVSTGQPATSSGGDLPDLPAGSPARRPADRVPAAGAAANTRIQRRPGESAEAWRSRGAALQMRYGYSKAALDRGDFAAAAGGFEAILMEEPGFLDAPGLLVQAQSGLRASARRLFEAGRALDGTGDWMGALQKYEQARQIYADIPGLAEGLQRVRGKLRTAGTNAFNEARQLEAGGRTQDALKEYEKAIQWLPPDDPNRQVARARVEQLRRDE